MSNRPPGSDRERSLYRALLDTASLPCITVADLSAKSSGVSTRSAAAATT
jgi:hypothetical protein